MIKFEIDVEKRLLNYECEGDAKELAVDAITCLKRTYEAIKEKSEDEAQDLILFAVSQLVNPQSVFYEKVDWEAEEWEDPQC